MVFNKKSTFLVLFLFFIIIVKGGVLYSNTIFNNEELIKFKSYIIKIADEVIKNPEKNKNGVFWKQITKENKELKSIDFYSGDTGIAYFLLKAYKVTKDKRYLETAKSSIDYTYKKARNDKNGLYFQDTINGLFNGNAGHAYTYLTAYKITKDSKYLSYAEEIAERIIKKPDIETKFSSPDIISGAAGTGLFLLEMFKTTGNQKYLKGAEVLGDFLIKDAVSQVKGVKWIIETKKKSIVSLVSHMELPESHIFLNYYMKTAEKQSLKNMLMTEWSI